MVNFMHFARNVSLMQGIIMMSMHLYYLGIVIYSISTWHTSNHSFTILFNKCQKKTLLCSGINGYLS